MYYRAGVYSVFYFIYKSLTLFTVRRGNSFCSLPLKPDRIFRLAQPKLHYETAREFSEPVFLNVYGAQESIPRNEFRQPM
jgi:hypothetical protein